MTEQIFQPFNDRMSRDIRNDLSESLVAVLKEKSMTPALEVADKYITDDLPLCYSQYIETRVERYRRCLERIIEGKTDPLWLALVLWDEQLFFEVHEVLEHAWLAEKGEEKLFLQAMIRAAGVYIKLDSGYDDAAGRIAAKAIPVLKKNHQRLVQHTAPELLIESLRSLALPPPKLLR